MYHTMFLLGFAVVAEGRDLKYLSSWKQTIYNFGTESLMKDYVSIKEDPKSNLPNAFTGRRRNDLYVTCIISAFASINPK